MSMCLFTVLHTLPQYKILDKPMITNYLETIFLNIDKLFMTVFFVHLYMHIGTNNRIKGMP